MKELEQQLEAIGLNEKEAKAYLAALELGPATAQQIAAKAAVVRPTAYVAIGGLVKRGLMSSFIKGKKQYFQAERPEQLLGILREKKKLIDEHVGNLEKIIPNLHALISFSNRKPEISHYEGNEGLRTMRGVLFATKAKELYVVGSPEKYVQMVDKDYVDAQNFRLLNKDLTTYQLVLYNKTKPKSVVKNLRWRYIKQENLETGEIAVFGDYIALIVYLEKPQGFLIKSRELASVASKLFKVAWAAASS